MYTYFDLLYYATLFYMNKIALAYCVLAIAFGVFIFIYGGYDDSPGAQGLGLIAVILGITGIVRNRKKTI